MLAVYLPSLIMAFCNGLVVPVLPIYARSFEVSYGLVGVVLAAQGVGTLLSDVPAGVLMRRIGHKKVMLLGGILSIGGVLALSWAQSLGEVLVYRLLSGAGSALWGISRHAYIAEIIQVGRRGRSIAVLGGLGRLGVFAGPALGGLIGSEFGLRAPFLAFAFFGLGGVVAVLLWVQGEGQKREEGQEKGRLSAVFRAHWQPLLTAGSGQLCAQTIRTARHIIIPLYGADVLGLDLKSVGLIISLSSAVDALMFYPAGLIMDRFGRKYASVPSFTIQALGMVLIPLSGGFGSLLAAATFIGLGNGLGSGTMMTLGADLAPAGSRGEFLGMWRFIGDAGHAGGPLVVGSMADLLGLSAAPLVVAGMGVLAAAILGLLVPETLSRQDGGQGGKP